MKTLSFVSVLLHIAARPYPPADAEEMQLRACIRAFLGSQVPGDATSICHFYAQSKRDLTLCKHIAKIGRTIREDWGNIQECDARFSCVVDLPHLEGLDPLTLDHGLLCNGCGRNARYGGQTDDFRMTAKRAYLRTQFLHHVKSCSSAQAILNGTRQRPIVEATNWLKLNSRCSDLWPDLWPRRRATPQHIDDAINDLAYGTERIPDAYWSRSSEIAAMIEEAKVKEEAAEEEEEQMQAALKRSRLEAAKTKTD